jgi:hypothetical protein
MRKDSMKPVKGGGTGVRTGEPVSAPSWRPSLGLRRRGPGMSAERAGAPLTERVMRSGRMAAERVRREEGAAGSAWRVWATPLRVRVKEGRPSAR